MNTFTFFALIVCAIFALVSATPAQPEAETSINGAEPIPADELFEEAETKGRSYYVPTQKFPKYA
uniref:Uncharacterized protein n=1 Tax=Heliothis virescens TaxID=7102 RepID=A0A2A4JNN0_HELVI